MIKEYKYLEYTSGLCPTCLKKVDAKIVQKEESVFILRHCPEHGESMDIIEEDAVYYNNRKQYDKPGNEFRIQAERIDGCPFDCGLCASHEQHTCIGLIEVTNRCNLKCPVCFANSWEGDFLPIEDFERMVDFFVESEVGQADILQISGGEPTLHPQILEMIDLARKRKISYVMLNTNGLCIADDPAFVEDLSKFKGGFEVYLQFDGFDDAIHTRFRGRPLNDVKLRAIKNLETYHIPTTLVTMLERDVNHQEIGRIINFGMSTRCVRGINFQPIAYFGRVSDDRPANRLTITSVIREIEKQTSSMIRKSDFIPLPCNVDRVAITYFYRAKDQSFIPLTRDLDVRQYLPFIRNTFKFDPDDFLKELSRDVFAKECCGAIGMYKKIVSHIPLSYLLKSEEEKISYVSDNTFRISITSFLDAYNFDIRSVQKECVHFITPGLKKIPFSTFNLLHRT